MFYSQFILAKKGPLGTIWIAAHLERKLRKNQVADTDIGVSVDSILFPDVPIALRLSSHLLLGVVRIYSRKVNYLFDDCSEALLKIKQAFRSTAVDLPPEESTAPYHSITLPETFDLDDFELPDNENFQGNYVDHHVSTREQITLQDTMEGVVYSTSQFGLDERFGDGDASQIGLDLEEDLFLDKNAATGNDGVLGADLQASVQPTTPPKKDNINEGISETYDAMAVHGAGYQIQGLIANSDFIEYAQAPSTPGLVEVPNMSSVQEALACDDHLETEELILTENLSKKNAENTSSKSDNYRGDENAVNGDSDHDTAVCIPPKENGHVSSGSGVKHAEQGDLPSTAMTMVHVSADDTMCSLDGPGGVENLQNGAVSNSNPSMPAIDKTDKECVESLGVRSGATVASPSCSYVASDLEDHGGKLGSTLGSTTLLVSEGPLEDNQASLKPGTEGNMEESCCPSNELAADAVCPLQTSGRSDTVIHEDIPSAGVPVLRPCNSNITQPDEGENAVVLRNLPSEDVGQHSIETSTMVEALHGSGASAEVQGEGCHETDVIKPVMGENQILEPASSKDVQADSGKLDDQLDNAISTDNQLENITASEVSELPAPEKLLSAPDGGIDKPNDLLVESTPDKEALVGSTGDAGTMLISGKKRSFTESTITVQSLNSVESFGLTRSKRTAESIPDDDDLLSSILVGRRSTVLKMKPTPPVPEVTSLKRIRSAPRPSASKRKVLMDDPMVLHGDTIRQQLTSTEDIRRLRKKAPCTRPEISTIERQFLEDGIFSQPIYGGMSTELNCLHNEKYELSGITVSETCENNSSLEAATDIGSPSRPDVREESGFQESNEPVIVRGNVEAQPAETLAQAENRQGEQDGLGAHDTDTQVQLEAITDVPELKTSEHEPCGESAQMDVDRECPAVADAANDLILSSAVDTVSGDIHYMPAGSSDGNASLQMDASCMSPVKKLDTDPVEEEASVVGVSNGKESGGTDDACNHILVDSEFRATDEFLPEESKAASPEISVCNNLASAYNDETADEIGERKLEVMNVDEHLTAELSCDDKNLASDHLHSVEEARIPHSIELDVDMPNGLSNEGEISGYQEADPQSTMDAEIEAPDHPSLEDRGDFENVGVEHDTDFLNVDDDEVAEEDDEYEPCAEETRLLENSGWSSRTRAVSKYLQTLFDKEAVHGRKVLPLDNLLAGKTRKEASRMFFETLVLKTRDYIHVEQPKPFDSIDIKPRLKLMKSNF